MRREEQDFETGLDKGAALGKTRPVARNRENNRNSTKRVSIFSEQPVLLGRRASSAILLATGEKRPLISLITWRILFCLILGCAPGEGGEQVHAAGFLDEWP